MSVLVHASLGPEVHSGRYCMGIGRGLMGTLYLLLNFSGNPKFCCSKKKVYLKQNKTILGKKKVEIGTSTLRCKACKKILILQITQNPKAKL